jgi:hypothetical protein
MRRPTSPVAALAAVALLGLGPLAACSDDGGTPSPARSTTTTASGPSTSTTVDPALVPRVLDPADLPAGFARDDTGIDTTITAFCTGQDAAAGLQARARLAAGFRREPPGASVVQLVFRFREGDAARFVAQAQRVLDGCSNVPDVQGLAFAYEPTGPEVDAVLGGSDGHVSRYGASVGSAKLTEEVAVFRHGDVGQLIAVLGVDLTRADLDQLATTAFRSAIGRATG